MTRQLHEKLDTLLDRAVDLWDAPEDSTDFMRLCNLLDEIEVIDRILYPDYWREKDKMTTTPVKFFINGVEQSNFSEWTFTYSLSYDGDNEAEDDGEVAPTLKSFDSYVVERGMQWRNQDTLIVKVEGLTPLAESGKLINDGSDNEICDFGYLGEYAFKMEDGSEKNWHVMVPEMTKS